MRLNLKHLLFLALILGCIIYMSRSSSSSPPPPKGPKGVPVIFANKATAFVSSSALRNFDNFWAFLPSWKPHLLEAIDRLVDRNTIFIDLGAWEGPATIYAAKKARVVFAVEPDHIAFRAIRSHVDVNPDISQKVVVSPICISDSDEGLRMAGRGEGGTAVERVLERFQEEMVRFGEGSVFETPCETLPQHLAEKGVGKDAPLFIKMDIEGSEAFVLPSIAEWVAQLKVKPTFFIGLHVGLLGKNDVMPFFRQFKKCGKELAVMKSCEEYVKELMASEDEVLELIVTDRL